MIYSGQPQAPLQAVGSTVLLFFLQSSIHRYLFFFAWLSFYDFDHHNHSVTISFKISTDVPLYIINLKEEADTDPRTFKVTASQ